MTKVRGDVRIRKEIVRWGIGGCNGAIRKNGLVKIDMTRDEDLSGGEVVAAETTMVRGVAKENAQSGSRVKFISGVKAWETQATENPKMIVGWVTTVV